jgi:hypothetical protein
MDDYEDFVRALLPRLLRYATMLTGERELRFRDGRPLTTRRYDQLWKRLGQRLPWVAAQGTSVHWLRHTTLTWVERHLGYGIARAYAGHTDNTGPATTSTSKQASRKSPPPWPPHAVRLVVNTPPPVTHTARRAAPAVQDPHGSENCRGDVPGPGTAAVGNLSGVPREPELAVVAAYGTSMA